MLEQNFDFIILRSNHGLDVDDNFETNAYNCNLHNIPMLSEYGRLVRKAFLPENNSLIMSSDYSQIELRLFAHMSQATELIDAFNNDMDICLFTLYLSNISFII